MRAKSSWPVEFKETSSPLEPLPPAVMGRIASKETASSLELLASACPVTGRLTSKESESLLDVSSPACPTSKDTPKDASSVIPAAAPKVVSMSSPPVPEPPREREPKPLSSPDTAPEDVSSTCTENSRI